MAYNILRFIVMKDTMIVAVKGGIDWAAYQGSIDLSDPHDGNEQEIAAHGSKLPAHVARAWFKELEDIPYRH